MKLNLSIKFKNKFDLIFSGFSAEKDSLGVTNCSDTSGLIQETKDLPAVLAEKDSCGPII